MHPADCPQNWEYDRHPDRPTVLGPAISAAHQDLRSGRLNSLDVLRDTRPFHYSVFYRLAPTGYEYFAGNYRGSEHRCLKFYAVMVPGDPRVGHPPGDVAKSMTDLSDIISNTISDLDGIMSLPNLHLSLPDKVLYLVAAVCMVFEQFLRIHPYANGNGHIGRFCVWAFLGRYNFWPRNWPVEPRPADPPYTELIKRHRDGDKAPLEMYILSLLMRY